MKLASLFVFLYILGAVLSAQYYISPFGSDSNSGSSPSSPFKTFSYASTKLPSGSQLIALPGLYSGSENAATHWDYTITITSQEGPAQTIIAGPGTWIIDSSVSISGLQFTNFASKVFDIRYDFISNNLIAYNNNLVYSVSGALIDVYIYNSNFTSNTMVVSHSTNEVYNTNLRVENSSFTQNAGGISGFYDDITIKNSTFTNNKCSYNGCALSVNKSETVTVNTTEFYSCISTANGGAIYFASGSQGVVILNSDFEENSAVNGGAIFSSDSIEITATKFTSNIATIGGALYLNGAAGTSVGATISEVNFSKNTGQSSAGAVYCTNSVVSYQSVDFISNYAPVGSSYQCGTGCTTYVYDVYSQGNNPSC